MEVYAGEVTPVIDLHFWNHSLPENCTANTVAIDSREIFHPQTLFVALSGTKTDGHQFVDAALENGAMGAIVREDFPDRPGVLLIRVKDPLKALQELALSHRIRMGTKIVGIAGMYGKTMLKDLLGKIVSGHQHTFVSPGSYNSQIGVPLSLLKIRPEHTIALVEMGASEVGELKRLGEIVQPDHMIITRIARRYITTFYSEEKIASEIDHLLGCVKEGNWRLIPEHSSLKYHPDNIIWNRPQTELPHANQISAVGVAPLKYQVAFSDTPGIEGKAHHCFHYIIDLLNMLIKGASLCGTPEQTIRTQLELFSPEPIRTEIWKSPTGILYINEPLSAERRFSLDLIRKWAPHGRHHVIEGENPAAQFQRIEEELRPQDAVLIRASTKIYPADLPNNRCVINLAAIRENLTSLQRKCGQNTRLMVMVKAFAYGMDDLQIARFLSTCGINILGVSCMDEAIALRRAGVTQAIFVIHVPAYEIKKALEWDVEIGISDSATLQAIIAEKPVTPLKVHLHVDTGMKRFGIHPEQALDLASEIHNSPYVSFEGIMTHLACADDPRQDAFTLKQISDFDAVIAALQHEGINPLWKHAANSGGLLRFNWPQYNMARIGLAAYGLYSSKASQTIPLRLSVSLQSRIVCLNTCRKGESVSYGRQYHATKDSETIAIVPIGYYDGLHRNYSGKGYTLIRGQKAPLVGNICMDFMMVNVTDIPEVAVGDSVLIFGEDDHGNLIPPEDVALSGNSIIHELISCLGPRIQRFFIVEEAQTTQLRDLK